MTCGDTCGTADWNIAHLVGKAPGDQAPTIRIDRPVQPSLRCRTVGQESAFVVGIGFRSRAPGPARAGHRSLRRGKRDVPPATLVAGDAAMPNFPAGRGRDSLNRTNPSLGTCSSAHFRFSGRTFVSRTQNPSCRCLRRHVGHRCVGAKNPAPARSKSRSACCCTLDDPSPSQANSCRASANCLMRSAGPGAGRRDRPQLNCSTAKFHTNRASAQCRSSITQAPTCPPTGNAYNQPRTRHRPSRLRPDLSTTGTP